MSEASVTVMPLADGDDAAEALAVNNSALAPTMAPRPVAAAVSARPVLSIVPKIVEQFDKKIDAPHRAPVVCGELQEWEDWAASGVTLFRHVTAMLGLPSTMHISTRLLSPEVRAKLCDLRDALEREAAEQAKR